MLIFFSQNAKKIMLICSCEIAFCAHRILVFGKHLLFYVMSRPPYDALGRCVKLPWGFSDCDHPPFEPLNRHPNPPNPNALFVPPPSRTGDYALLSLPFACGASLGTVFTSVVAFFTSVSLLALSSFTIFPLGKKRGRNAKEKEEILLASLSLSFKAKLSVQSCLLCLFPKEERGKNEGKTCTMLWGNLFSLLELNAFHT